MNLFLLSLDRQQCVRWYADKHVVKMILELAQLLYSAWGVLSEDDTWRQLAPEGSYKTTHINHPISKWIRQSKNNYIFAASYAHPMLAEYTRRYNKTHKCTAHLDWLVNNIPNNIPDGELTQCPQAMPDEFKVNDGCGTMDDTVMAYKAYYIGDKIKNIRMTYKNTEWPEWLPKQDVDEFKSKKLKEKLEKQAKDARRKRIKKQPSTTQ